MKSSPLRRFLSLSAVALLATGCIGLPSGDPGSSVACGIVCFTEEQAGKQVDLGSYFLASDALAQSFKLTGLGATVRRASIRVKAMGGTFPTGSGQTLTLSIHGDTGGSPGNLFAGTTQTIDLSLLTMTEQFATVTFSAPVTLLAGTYWLVVTPSYAIPNITYVQWSANDTFATGYADGMAKYRANGMWQSGAVGTLRDLVFALN